jgi:tRNA(Ile)-lysidine synthase
MAASPSLHYHQVVRANVLHYIRERGLMRAGDRVCMAVSGGADSVALLRVLLELRAELGVVLAVAHFNHGLRGEDSEADEAFVADLARHHGLEFFASRADVREHALAAKLSVESAGRGLRYRWLTQLAEEHRFNSVATAHTLDDQAETVLLKFLRGAGTRGLAGIYPILEVCGGFQFRIVRPLLGVTRDEVEAYLTSFGQNWREDESNLDHRFTRNRVRHSLLPLLEREYNPNIRQVLSDAAELARAEEEYWQALVEGELENRLQLERLSLEGFAQLPLAFQRGLLRRFVETEDLALDFEHVDNLVRCAGGEFSKTELPGGWLAVRRGKCLELRAPETEPAPVGYEYTLPIPGEVHIAEVGFTVRAVIVEGTLAQESDETASLLSAAGLGPELTVRNWRPGDRFWPLHTRSEEKLKRLFAEKHIPAEQRATWPVVLKGEEIVWVRGFPVGRAYAWGGRGDGVKIVSD